jgi:uncharacterized protein with GYD domain
MAKFLVKADYKSKGVRGLVKEGGTSRRATIKGLVEGMGGKLESFYFTYGDADAYLIIDFPDTASALGLSLAVNGSGAVTTAMVPLITAEEIDAAAKKVPVYRAPGEAPAAKASKKR